MEHQPSQTPPTPPPPTTKQRKSNFIAGCAVIAIGLIIMGIIIGTCSGGGDSGTVRTHSHPELTERIDDLMEVLGLQIETNEAIGRTLGSALETDLAIIQALCALGNDLGYVLPPDVCDQ